MWIVPAWRVYVNSFYRTIYISFYKSFYTFRMFLYFLQLYFHGHFVYIFVHPRLRTATSLFYSYIFAAIFMYIFVHPRLHSSVDAQRRHYSTPTLTCECTAVSTVLQLHFRSHFRVHFRTSTPTFICGRTAMSLFYTYTHLWMYSGLYSATPTLICGCTAVSTVPDVCRRLYSTPTLISSSLHFTYHICLYVYACLWSLHSTLQRPITCLVFKVAKSAWLHFTHQTETSLFSTF